MGGVWNPEVASSFSQVGPPWWMDKDTNPLTKLLTPNFSYLQKVQGKKRSWDWGNGQPITVPTWDSSLESEPQRVNMNRTLDPAQMVCICSLYFMRGIPKNCSRGCPWICCLPVDPVPLTKLLCLVSVPEDEPSPQWLKVPGSGDMREREPSSSQRRKGGAWERNCVRHWKEECWNQGINSTNK